MSVQPGDRDEDGISIAADALELSGATITAANGKTSVDLTHQEVGADGGGKVDGSLVTPPRVTAVSLISAPGRGGHVRARGRGRGAGRVRPGGDGDRRSSVGVDHRLRHAVRGPTSGSWRGGPVPVTSCYAVQAGDRDEDGMSIAANALVVDGGSITAADGTTGADLTHAAVTPVGGGKVNGSREVTPPRVKEHLIHLLSGAE